MASSTGIPGRLPNGAEETGLTSRETEPLLGRPGDVAQEEGQSTLKNLVLGTGIIAQLGIWLLVVLIWASVLTKPLILFSGHPLAQSFAVLVLVQSVLSLQPTHTVEQKRIGQRVHGLLNLLAFLALVAGVGIIEYNKEKSHNAHFHSVHGYLGVFTSVVLLLQYLVGFTMWATPKLYGGEDKAKAIWKYHRYSGYFVLLLLLATINSATQTEYNEYVLKLKLWATIVLSILVVIGIFPRIQKQKLGFNRPSVSL
ncbi:eukaryotic cytochrome b561 domain-containing protein [Trichoderma ceciliae]